MHIHNHTQLVPMVSAGLDVRDRLFGVFILRGTFHIAPHEPLQLDAAQAELLKSDVFHGAPAQSSLRHESDLAPHKPRSDVCINAIAHAPGGWAAPTWNVRVSVGRVTKELRVCGPRRWVREGNAYRLTEPEACEQVPMHYEKAFGGVWASTWGEPDVLQENPVGVGYVRQGESPTEAEWPAPQIESPNDPIGPIGRPHRPEGLGPIFRAWLPRRALGGTYDDVWQRQRFPLLPLDFDFGFWNCAHPDLIYPGYLVGDEEVVLDGLCPESQLRFSLPGERFMLGVELRDGARASSQMVLDTLVIDVPERRAHLTWRAMFPRVEDVRFLRVLPISGGHHG